jgi:hypothetical protein
MSGDEIDLVRQVLSYEASTGKMYWTSTVCRNRPAGTEAGHLQHKGHVVIQVNKKRYMAHRLAWLLHYGVEAKGEIDHINGRRDDNRIENLRAVTTQINQQNRKAAQSNNKSGLLGVSFHKRTGRWVAQIKTPSSPKRHLGLFDTPEQAHRAYLFAKRQFHEGCTI